MAPVWSPQQGSWMSYVAAKDFQEKKVEATVFSRREPGISTASLLPYSIAQQAQPRFKGLHRGSWWGGRAAWGHEDQQECSTAMGPQEATSEIDKHTMQSPIHFTYCYPDCLVAGEGGNPLKVLAVLQIMELFFSVE